MSVAQVQQINMQAADRIWHLRQSPLFEGLDIEELAALAEKPTDRVFQEGEIIFDKGDSTSFLYLLNRGCVQIAISSAAGREKVLAFLRNGDVFGESLFNSEGTHELVARAHQECWVSILSGELVQSLCRQIPRIYTNLIRILSDRLTETQTQIEALAFMATEQRLARTLLHLADKHGKEVFGNSRQIKLKLTLSHEHLSRLIGANRPHVSTIMSRFRKEGWIHYHGRRLILEMADLRNLIHSGL